MKKVLIYFSVFFSIFCFSNQTLRPNYNQYFNNLSETFSEEEGNFCFSPFSINSCLQLTMLGANGQTYLEFVEALFPHSFEVGLHYPQFSKDENSYAFKSASKLFVNQDEELLKIFTHHSRVFFQALPQYLDFTEPESSASTINQWISDQTEELINKIVSPEDINPDLRLLLVNTLYLDGSWRIPFSKEWTQEGSFFNVQNEEQTLPFLTQEEHHPFYEDEECSILVLKIQSGQNQPELGCVFYLPKNDNPTPLQSSLKYFSHMKDFEFNREYVHVEIPKVNLSSSLDLKPNLMNMGIETAFSLFADFSKMNGKTNLFLSKVLHKCKVELTESGVTAAAVTAAFMNVTCLPDRTNMKEFIANKPFSFMIYDFSNDTCLFTGQFVQHG